MSLTLSNVKARGASARPPANVCTPLPTTRSVPGANLLNRIVPPLSEERGRQFNPVRQHRSTPMKSGIHRLIDCLSLCSPAGDAGRVNLGRRDCRLCPLRSENNSTGPMPRMSAKCQTQTSLGCPISYLSALSRSRCRGVLWTRWIVLLKPRICDAVQYIGRHSKQRRR